MVYCHSFFLNKNVGGEGIKLLIGSSQNLVFIVIIEFLLEVL